MVMHEELQMQVELEAVATLNFSIKLASCVCLEEGHGSYCDGTGHRTTFFFKISF